MPSMTFDRFDVAVVPFPFTDRAAVKRRPALVLSDASFNRGSRHSVMAMITSVTDGAWPLDVTLADLKTAGLSVSCAVRFKLFTLDNSLVLRKSGKLGKADRVAVQAAMKSLFGA